MTARRTRSGRETGSSDASSRTADGLARPAPLGGPIAQRRAASPDRPSTDDGGAHEPAAGGRTLVSVPSLPHSDAPGEGDADVSPSVEETESGNVVPLTSVVASPSAPDDEIENLEEEEPKRSPPLLSVVADQTETDGGDVAGDRLWVEPQHGRECPAGYPVKANDNSRIFHVPGGRFYDRTIAERCYVSAEAAEADGYRPAKA